MSVIIEKCLSYDKTNGCMITFNGQCNMERCQTYNLLQENEKLKDLLIQIGCPTLASAKRKVFNLKEQNQTYIQKLKELREFALVYSDNHDAYETVYKFLIDKINEVLND